MVPGGDTQRRSCHIRNFSKKNSSRGISFLLRQNISRKVQKKRPTNFHCCPLSALALLSVVFLDQWVWLWQPWEHGVHRNRPIFGSNAHGQRRPWPALDKEGPGSVIYFVCHSLGQYNGVIHRNGMYIVPGAFQWPSPKVKAKSVNLAWDWIKGNMCYASNGVSLNLKGTKRWRKKIGDMILLIGTSGWRNTALIGLLTLPLTGRGALGWSGGPAYPHSSLLY